MPKDEGDTCDIEVCNGRLVFAKIENCSCHIRPPCRSCVETPLICNTCELEVGEELSLKDMNGKKVALGDRVNVFGPEFKTHSGKIVNMDMRYNCILILIEGSSTAKWEKSERCEVIE